MKRLLPLMLVALLPACRGAAEAPAAEAASAPAAKAAPKSLDVLLTSNGWGELEPCG